MAKAKSGKVALGSNSDLQSVNSTSEDKLRLRCS